MSVGDIGVRAGSSVLRNRLVVMEQFFPCQYRHDCRKFIMMIESVYIGMPVYHKDGCSLMAVRRVLATGLVLCVRTESDGQEVEQQFLPDDLELGPLKIGGLLLAGL